MNLVHDVLGNKALLEGNWEKHFGLILTRILSVRSTYEYLYICTAIICSSISIPLHGSVTPPECTANPREGTVCTLACKNGYSLVQYSGSQYQTLCSAGRWTRPSSFYCRGKNYDIQMEVSSKNITADAAQLQCTLACICCVTLETKKLKEKLNERERNRKKNWMKG